MTFVNLHRHSRWSLLDGTGSGDQYAERAKELGQGALAITDHGTLAGALEHIAACQKAGIVPIMGCEVYFRENRLDRTLIDGADKNGKAIKKLPKRFHLTLLAKNYEGWLNLQRMTSEAYLSGMIDFRDRPCVDWDLLSRYNEGIYCLGGCFASILSQDIDSGGYMVGYYIDKFRQIFGDRFSLEIMPHDWDKQRTLNIAAVNIANEYSIQLTATGDTHYPFKEWASTQDVMLMAATKQTNIKRKKKTEAGEEVYTMAKENPTLWLMGAQDMADTFAQFHPYLPSNIIHEAIHNTGEIIRDFSPFMLDRSIKMPKITRSIITELDPVAAFDQTEDPDELVKSTLRRWAKTGLDDLEKLYPASHWEKYPRSRYEAEIEKEFAVFDEIGIHVWRYMLMVAGEVRWARDQEIIVGPGRGSAAGSRVAYVIGITDIDPLSYDLMFERFINVNRKGMPDIDIDFMPGARGRDLVEQHTGLLYGEHNVIKVAAYGTYGPKSALRAVCRIFDDVIDYPTADRYVKALDALGSTDKLDLQQCADRFPEIAEFKQRFPVPWTHAERMLGSPYTQSVHASAVIVKPNDEMLPVAAKKDQDTEEGVITTAWPDTRELLTGSGWLKIDYLVIEGLVRQYEVLKLLRERDDIDIDLRKLPIRWDPFAVDKNVMEVFHRGMTLGVWQMEGKGTIPVLKAVKPDNMHDLAAINALIRPGARGAGVTDQYAKRKHGQAEITYWHDSVEPVLRNTLGLMIYQEQMMEIAVTLGDFTRTEADDLRKAMGKKYREGMPAVVKFLDDLGFGPKFIHNASNKVGEEHATVIWQDKMLPMGEYSFNASHAYCYSAISYEDALLKVAAPAYFYTNYLASAATKDLPIKLAGVMREGARFGVKVTPPDINKSGRTFTSHNRNTIMYGVQSVKGVGPTGVHEILGNRPFHSYEHFEDQVQKRAVNKNARDALIGCGAFDEFGKRAHMSTEQKAALELAYMGVRLSGKSDLEKYADLIEETIHSEDEFDFAQHGDRLCVGGEIVGVKQTHTKARNEPMGFVTVAYGVDSYRVTLFPPVWAIYADQMIEGRVMFFQGKKDVSDQHGAGFIAQECVSLPELVAIKDNEQVAA